MPIAEANPNPLFLYNLTLYILKELLALMDVDETEPPVEPAPTIRELCLLQPPSEVKPNPNPTLDPKYRASHYVVVL